MIVVPCSDNVNPIYLQTTTLLGHHYSGPRCDSSIHQNKDFDINVGSVLSFSLLSNLHAYSSIPDVRVVDTFFRQIKSFLRFCLAFVFGLQTYYLIDFSKNYRLKSLEPKNKG